MKRKIAAILAADIAGYSRLIAEDEEDTLRRLATYRSVFAEFVERSGGRIFNTAGDAVLAEFQSAVDAVRCAVDIQETLRARNHAYPASRHMNFRIGITIGDIVERDGDLLGDGVNIAARLEGLATPGGICISRSVHEAVASKLTLRFADVGMKKLKNIPDPVHAYTVALQEPNARMSIPLPRAPTSISSRSMIFGAAALALILLSGLLLFWRGFGEEQQSAHIETKPPISAAPTPTVSSPPQPANKAKPDVKEAAPVQPPTLAPVKSGPAPAPGGDSLTSHVILTRQWEDCLQGAAALAIPACKALIDRRAIDGNDLAEIHYKYGRALRDNGEPDQALESYTESIRLHPTAEAFTHRGVAYYDKGDDRKAIEDYSEALRLDPRSAEAANNRAWTRFKAGDLANALKDADLAVRLDGGLAYTWDTRGHINEAMGKNDAAVRDFRKALSLDPNSQDSRAGLTRLGASP